MASKHQPKTSSMDSTFPVLLPEDTALFLPQEEFDAYVQTLLATRVIGSEKVMRELELDAPSEATLVDPEASSPTADIKIDRFARALIDTAENPYSLMRNDSDDADSDEEKGTDNKILTENRDVAFKSTGSPLADLFGELEKVVASSRLHELLSAAWNEDEDATLKIIWHARSIHIGKGEKDSFYRCLGWMRNYHPLTLLKNLKWLCASVIAKKIKNAGEDDSVMIELPKESRVELSDAGFTVPQGVSHGYFKDLADILVLAAKDEFSLHGNPTKVLAKKNDQGKRTPASLQRSDKTQKLKKQKLNPEQQLERQHPSEESNRERSRAATESRHKVEADRHAKVVQNLTEPFYRALHLTVARIFATQLRDDLKLLKSGSKKDINSISYAAKWAPSLEGFHDKHTILASTIAEALFHDALKLEEGEDREQYLKRAREKYRAEILSPLRKALQIVERDISANTFDKIQYEKVPSLAMDRHKELFIKKDLEHFERYIEKVAEGKSRISGAVLMPATLVKQARAGPDHSNGRGAKTSIKAMLQSKRDALAGKVGDGQWETLVQRIKDSGKISSSIAVCDVSGSMSGPVFPDGTCPMDSSIGLSLLLSEVTEPPFGGSIITFHSNPSIIRVGGASDKRTFTEKVKHIQRSPWGMSTDFQAVFSKLILPMAKKHNLKASEMVKQIFVFSDMQFDNSGDKPWTTTYSRIKTQFEEAGYEMPTLIFWNLAGGRAGYTGRGNPIAPKPVTHDVVGTAIVSGYSTGMMKTFLDTGELGAKEDEEDVETVEVGEDGVVEIVRKQKASVDPVSTVRKAIAHKGFDMLKVVD